MRQCCTVVELYNNYYSAIIFYKMLYFLLTVVKALVQLMTRH